LRNFQREKKGEAGWKKVPQCYSSRYPAEHVKSVRENELGKKQMLIKWNQRKTDFAPSQREFSRGDPGSGTISAKAMSGRGEKEKKNGKGMQVSKQINRAHGSLT